MDLILIVTAIVTTIGTVALAITTWLYRKDVKRQAETMEKQSNLMYEKMEYDRLVKSYERLLKEMNNLVAPLYTMKNNDVIFSLQISSRKWQDAKGNEHFTFWEGIKQNMYLSTPDLHSRLIDYFSKENMFWTKNQQPEKDAFDASKEELKKLIEQKYSDLDAEIKEIEAKLGI
jgi:hypothetical protein